MADIDLATVLADGEYLKREGDLLVGEIPSTGTPGAVDAEGAVDATATALAAGTHTNVTVTYNDTAGSISLASTSSGGSTILDGTATPGDLTGAVGNYYAQTDIGVLYGPKYIGAGYGTVQQFTIGGTPNTTTSNKDGGVRVSFDVAGQITGCRYQRYTSGATTLAIRAWNDTSQTKIGEVFDTQSTSGWFTVSFPTPVPVAATGTYTFTVGAATGIPQWGGRRRRSRTRPT